MNGRVDELKKKPLLVPWALFAGVIVAFAACCFQGWKSTQTNVFERFSRFHQLLCPETHFYPTASQVQRLAQKRTKKECINVIIGGSSILNGTRQLPDEVWSGKLAELLGPDYRVLNLGFRAAGAGEFGAIIAETLLKRRRVIFVTDMGPFSSTSPDGDSHRYFFWDAWHKGLIGKNVPRRAAWAAALPENRATDLKYREVRAGAWLNSEFYFNDLWNTLAYTTGGTVWNPVTQGDSFRPRMSLRDNDPGPLPLDARLAAMKRHLPPEKFIRIYSRGTFLRRTDGHWEIEPSWLKRYRELVEDGLPNEALRQRTVMLIHIGNPYCLNQLSTEEQEKWDLRADVTKQVIGELGMHPLLIGTGFHVEDYADHFHITGSGGEKMAALAAPAIKQLARQLGYEDELKNQKE